MFPSRKLSITFAAVFAIGVAVGALIMWDLFYAKPIAPDPDLSQLMIKMNDPVDVIVKRINDRYVNTYHLSAEEMEKIQPLILELAQNLSQVRHGFSTQILATMDDSHQKIAALLTPEHRAVFDKGIADRRKLVSALLLDKNSSTPPSP